MWNDLIHIQRQASGVLLLLPMAWLHPPGRDRAKAGTKEYNPAAARRRCQWVCNYPGNELDLISQRACCNCTSQEFAVAYLPSCNIIFPLPLVKLTRDEYWQGLPALFLLTHLFLLGVFFSKVWPSKKKTKCQRWALPKANCGKNMKSQSLGEDGINDKTQIEM